MGDGYDLATLPYSLKILLENLMRFEDGRSVTKDDVAALASWQPGAASNKEIAYRPARVLLQDFTGVPCVVDLAAMRDAIADFGGDPKKINPLQPVELVIDHSVQVDAWASPEAFEINADFEFERNGERYAFLKWGQSSLDGFRAVPPDTGIVHQVNIEYLARVIFGAGGAGEGHPGGATVAYPDTVVGTDSHTTMVNGLGVLAWGVGGIEAEAAMLGQPVTMLIPDVIGFKLTGKLREGVTATDLALQITQMLRKKGVVGKFVEFYGAGLSSLPVADRTVIGNMSPEYGSTVAIFPIDALTLDYLRLTGRAQEQIELVEAYAKAQGMFRTDDSPEPRFTDTLALDLSDVVPNLAGPRRPQDRVPLTDVKATFNVALEEWQNARDGGNGKQVDRFEGEGGGGTAVAGAPAHAGVGRRGRDRGDHVVHEHVEPRAADRCGTAREESRRERPQARAVGEDVACAGLESRHRLLAQGGLDAVSRRARLQPRRLRLHDVHRQQRAARRRRRARGRRARSDRGGGAVGQPQLRRPHPSAGARELPRVAAARRGVRARGAHGRRPHHRTARPHRDRRRRVLERSLADERGDRRRARGGSVGPAVPAPLRRRVRGRQALVVDERAGRRALRVGPQVRVREAAAVFRRDAQTARGRARHFRRARARDGRRLRDDGSHLAGGQHRRSRRRRRNT